MNSLTDEKDEQLDDLLKDISDKVEYGPPLIANVSSSFTKTVTRPLSKETKSALAERMKIPENCKEFSAPKVNSEIWRLLPSHAKISDVKHQQTQQMLGIGLSAFANMANTLAANKNNIPKELMTTLLKQAIDGANALGDQFQSISTRRRHEMKKFLNPEYSGICLGQVCFL